MRSSPWVLLAIAIVAEVIATSALRASNGFSRLVPSAVVVVGYGVSFYCLSLTLKSLPVGIVYAVWSGVGIVLITLVAMLFFKQVPDLPDLPALLGLGLIVAGVLVLNLFSKMQAH
ncbi:small multidrug resistance pump [Paraburkholderia tropica]|uniref:Small multidrug resistance pump n=1 Tax=Paraburkholderia tropica TaxID=92647 RepID=A0ABX5MMT0_9BURK|nr:multidrug efflux SMR transporter [Paraburkholderia tropica]PXX14458.1 small multidrug resistance pump [Paraburkholderia tropica]PZW79524.1 small multidrug resistance pump [Paraburkholderia tropica]